MYDTNRRLSLMRTSKAYVKRSGFSRHCAMIASVSTEQLLKAMALHGEKADIRELLRSPDVDVSLKRALGGVLQASASVLGTEGHRSQIRLRGHAAGWHYGNAHVFMTPNLADSRAALLLQLHTQGVDGQVENYEVSLGWDLEQPILPCVTAMRRILAADPVSQARFFDLMMTLFFEEVLGCLPPFKRASFRAGQAGVYEDGFAASTFPGCFGDIAAFCGPLETQGRGSMHPHILIVLLGHDLASRLRCMMASSARGELVIELERWRAKVLEAACRIRYDSQLALAAQLSVEASPLPLGERQRESAGEQYAERRVLATVHVADWTGQLDNVLVGGAELAVLARVADEQALAQLLRDKGPQALCFKGPFDARLGTSQRLGQPRGALLQSSQASQASASAPTQFQILAARPSFGEAYDERARPMVKKVTRLVNEMRDGAVLPVQSLFSDLSCSDLGTFFTRGSVFAECVTLLAFAKDEPSMDEVDIGGEKHLVTKHQQVFSYPHMDGAQPFAIEAFCHFTSCHLFNMADGQPRFLVGRVLRNEATDAVVLHVEWMSRATEAQVRNLETERAMVWDLLAGEPTLQSNKRPATSLIEETPTKVKCAAWDVA